ATQRSQAGVDQIAIVPLRDVLNDDRSATIFDYFARAKSSRIIVSEYDEVETHANKLLEQFQRSYSQAMGTAADGTADDAVTSEEWDELGAGEDDADLVVERAELKARRRALPRNRPVIDLPSPGELFIDWELVERRLAQATRLAELGLDDDAPLPAAADLAAGDGETKPPAPRLEALPAHHVRCQPAVEMR